MFHFFKCQIFDNNLALISISEGSKFFIEYDTFIGISSFALDSVGVSCNGIYMSPLVLCKTRLFYKYFKVLYENKSLLNWLEIQTSAGEKIFNKYKKTLNDFYFSSNESNEVDTSKTTTTKCCPVLYWKIANVAAQVYFEVNPDSTIQRFWDGAFFETVESVVKKKLH